MEEIAEFKRELARLINKHGYDSKLNMPDFIIANLIYSNLDNLVKANKESCKGYAKPELDGDWNVESDTDKPM